ncbi:Hypothetical predicted protein [Cloeon dipterum]|nr:Hypothetical predicted protein [Cloeon dipterum]
MTYLDRKKKTNLNAVRVTVEPDEKNFITFFSSVEISAESEDSDGCVFVCIVTELHEVNGEVYATIDEEFFPIKEFLYPTIGPSTGNWIGKPKIFVFLNSTEKTKKRTHGEVSQVYENTKFSKRGTIHQGLLTLILPQTRQDQYTVFIISSYAGWGKSVLAETIANRAAAENIVAILDLRKNSEFHKALIRTKEYRDLFRTYWKMKGKNSFFYMPQFIVLDNMDDLIDECFLKMVAQLATDKVGLLISTRPQNMDILEMHLEGICPVTAISMETASREKQIDFLHRRIGSGVNQDKLKEILNYLDNCGADDLIEKLGALEKVTSYPKLTDINIYELSEHIFDCTVKTVLHRAFGLTNDKSDKFKKLRKEHERQLSILSYNFFMDNTVEENFLENTKVLDDYGIITIIESRVVVLSDTLAAYLCVSQGLISTQKQIKKLPQQEILRNMMQCKRKIKTKAK